MCLYISRKERIASEDIVCYKMFTKKNGSPYLYGIIKGRPFPDTREIQKAEGKMPEYIPLEGAWGIVTRGVYHSYKYIREFEDPMYYNIFVNGIIFKCIIPKGTPYFSGVDRYGNLSYASKYLRLEDEISRDTPDILDVPKAGPIEGPLDITSYEVACQYLKIECSESSQLNRLETIALAWNTITGFIPKPGTLATRVGLTSLVRDNQTICFEASPKLVFNWYSIARAFALMFIGDYTDEGNTYTVSSVYVKE